MRTIVLVLVPVLVLGCRTSKPTSSDDAAPLASSSAPVAAVADAAPAKKTPIPPTLVVEQWNVAHIQHDAKALENLYSARVDFYGQSLTDKQCAEAKKKAFEKAPDYTQTIRDLDVKPDGTVTFTKTSTSKGKSTDYPAILVVRYGLIFAETDKITEANLAVAAAKDSDWCNEELVLPNDKVKAPYKISALEACVRLVNTKYFKDLVPAGAFYDHCAQVTCPTKCDQKARACGYDIRIEDHTPGRQGFSNLVEWVYVDAVDAKLYWNDGKNSEPLPPKP